MELVVVVHDGSNQQLHGRLGHKQTMSGENTTDAAVSHTTEEAHSRTVAAVGTNQFRDSGDYDDGDNKYSLTSNPDDELFPPEELE